MSCKFDKEICNGLVSMVFTSVTIKKVWLSDRQTHAHTDRRRTKWPLCAAMLRRRHKIKLISIDVQCDLDLWPLTSKINRVHPLITVNMSCKFDKEICNGLVSMVFTSKFDKEIYNGLVSMVFTSVTIKKVWLSDRQTHARTHRQTPDKVIPMCRYASQATQ